MSEEEKQAMQYFYNLRSTIDESFMLFDEGINVKCGKEMIEKISIIFNIIAKLQKQNKEKDRILKIRLNYEEAYAKLRKQYEELISTNIIKNEEIKQKDKQIDLMAKYIDEIDVSEDICEGKTICDENCKYCIKQYFETKAKGEYYD